MRELSLGDDRHRSIMARLREGFRLLDDDDEKDPAIVVDQIAPVLADSPETTNDQE